MKRLITIDDFIDVYGKTRQRGLSFIFSKFTINGLKRTQSAFENKGITSANWWIIPRVHERWNALMTGNPAMGYEAFLSTQYLKGRTNLRLLSLGSGDGAHELELATYGNYSHITCVDIVQTRLDVAASKVNETHEATFEFICKPVHQLQLEASSYDVVLFNQSLHHFKNVDYLLGTTVKAYLKTNGLLVINEYVGPDRLQFPNYQIKAINKGLQLLPTKFKKRLKRNVVKNRFYGSGWLRMVIADPSECVDSSCILPACHKHFTTVYERGYGGNIIMNVLKDIAHHFTNPDQQTSDALNQLFDFEDAYLKTHTSDFVFGIYKKG